MRTISLPEPIHLAAERLAAQAGFASADEYIADLVSRDAEQNPPEPFPPLRQFVEEAASRTLTDAEWGRYDQRLESLLIEGLESGPATEMTDEDWSALHRRLEVRLDTADGCQRLESLLLEGLDSGPATVMDAAEWESIRQEIRERREKRNPPSNPDC